MNWSQRYYKKSQISIDTFSLLLSLMTAIYIKNGAFVFPKTLLDGSNQIVLISLSFGQFIFKLSNSVSFIFKNRC